MLVIIRNGYYPRGLLYDLGFDVTKGLAELKTETIIKTLETTFDLVLITELFDESLELLRNFLCWSYDDVVYEKLYLNFFSHIKVDLSSQAENKLREWLKKDIEVYRHFRVLLNRKLSYLSKNCNNFSVETLKKHRAMVDKMCEHSFQRLNEQCQQFEFINLFMEDTKCPCLPLGFIESCFVMKLNDQHLGKLIACAQRHIYTEGTMKETIISDSRRHTFHELLATENRTVI